MEIPIFLMLSDKLCMQKLDTFFKLKNIPNCRVILQSCHMNPVKNKKVNCGNIQLYVEDFIDQLYKNPHFTTDKLHGAPPKVIKDFFTDGFLTPAFKKSIKNLGTTDINATIELLPDIYTELDNHLRWKQIFDCPDEQSIDTPPKDCSGCSYCYPHNPHLSQFHADDNCFILHPEKYML